MSIFLLEEKSKKSETFSNCATPFDFIVPAESSAQALGANAINNKTNIDFTIPSCFKR